MNYIKKNILRYFMIHYYNHIFLCLSNETWSPTHFFKGEQKYDTLWWDKTYEINQPRSFHEMSWFSYIKSRSASRQCLRFFKSFNVQQINDFGMFLVVFWDDFYLLCKGFPPIFSNLGTYEVLFWKWVVEIWVTLGKTCANMEEWCMNKCFSVDRFF